MKKDLRNKLTKQSTSELNKRMNAIYLELDMIAKIMQERYEKLYTHVNKKYREH
jgi:hypothetical protein